MRVSFLVILPVAVSAIPAVNPSVNAAFCQRNNYIISALQKESIATRYCSSFLSIRTSIVFTTTTIASAGATVTVPLTQTIGAVAVTRPVTNTVTETATITTTSTEVVLFTTTGTPATTSTATCLNNVIPRAARDEKRQSPAINRPKAIPKDWSNQYISVACTCLAIPTPSTTQTTTETVLGGTITVTNTAKIIQTYTVDGSITTTTTITAIATAPNAYTSTSTMVMNGVATSVVASEAQYRVYRHSFDERAEPTDRDSYFNAAYFRNAVPFLSGTISTLNFATDEYPTGSVNLDLPQPGGLIGFDADQTAVLIQGFFLAKESGSYTLTSRKTDVDTWAYLWTLPIPSTYWYQYSPAFKSSGGGVPNAITGSYTFTLNIGETIPFTYLWANGAGPGQSLIRIITPSGQEITDFTGYLVPPCDESGLRL